MKKERSSNIELYRIVTMLLIVAHHYVVNSGLTAAKGVVFAHPLSKRSLFLLFFGAWGKTGINCFVLITGYFMCKSNITAKKFAKLLFEVLFYRLVINSIFWITGMEKFSRRGLLYTFLVVRNIGDGFTSAYLMFFLFIPFINILIEGLDERMHLVLLGLLGFMYVVLGTFSIFSVTMNYVSWFMVVYLIAGSTFGVLLIHAHSDTMRKWLWKDVLDNVGHYGSRFMPLHAVGSVIGVFAVCTVIDLVRIRVLEKPFFRLWDKIAGMYSKGRTELRERQD